MVGIGSFLYRGLVGHVDGDRTDREFEELQLAYALYVAGIIGDSCYWARAVRNE